MAATPNRLRRVKALIAKQNGPDAFERVIAHVEADAHQAGRPELVGKYLDFLCLAWLGPIERRSQRWDKGCPRGQRSWQYKGLK